jgi:hypothetical protein
VVETKSLRYVGDRLKSFRRGGSRKLTITGI